MATAMEMAMAIYVYGYNQQENFTEYVMKK